MRVAPIGKPQTCILTRSVRPRRLVNAAGQRRIMHDTITYNPLCSVHTISTYTAYTCEEASACATTTISLTLK